MTDAEFIKRMLENFSVWDNGEVHWPWREDISLNEMDPKLAAEVTKRKQAQER